MPDKEEDDKKKNKKKIKDKDGSKYVELEPTIDEELLEDELDEILSVAQRRKKGRTMKRFAKRNARKRKISMRKKASNEKLKQRAIKKARGKIKDRLAGGKKYSDLSMSQKVQIDKRASRYKKKVDSIAKRELPAVRKAEMERVVKMRSSKKEDLDLNSKFEIFLEEKKAPKKRYHRLFDSDNKPFIDKRFKIYRTSSPTNEDFLSDAVLLKEMIEDRFEDDPTNLNETETKIPSTFGNIKKGDKIYFQHHSMEMSDDEPTQRRGIVVGGDTSYLRVRGEYNKIVYKVRHKDAILAENLNIFDLEEAFELRSLEENAPLSKIVDVIHKQIKNGKYLHDIIDEILKLTGIDISSRALTKAYIDKYGDPLKSNPVSSKKSSALKKKYLGRS